MPDPMSPVMEPEVALALARFKRKEPPPAPSHYTVVWRDDCVWCDRAKELLHLCGESFVAVKFDSNLKPLFAALGLTTLPQIWHGTAHVGGFTELKERLDDGR